MQNTLGAQAIPGLFFAIQIMMDNRMIHLAST